MILLSELSFSDTCHPSHDDFDQALFHSQDALASWLDRYDLWLGLGTEGAEASVEGTDREIDLHSCDGIYLVSPVGHDVFW